VNVYVPTVVGVPVIAPVVELTVKPGGIAPVITKVKGAVPPAGLKLPVYATPTVPVGGTLASVGSGFTVIVAVAKLFVPATSAVNVTIICDVIPAGAVYTTVKPVVFDKLPHALPDPHASV
jgi:hypothetical protein